ncbi:hypothetical protein T484DRAFT_1743888 [Baffinella frigidus]|nr:hypothetical protein T484DRAFT_1743888 [Cryptophyta sp. CCMP2293]
MMLLSDALRTCESLAAQRSLLLLVEGVCASEEGWMACEMCGVVALGAAVRRQLQLEAAEAEAAHAMELARASPPGAGAPPDPPGAHPDRQALGDTPSPRRARPLSSGVYSRPSTSRPSSSAGSRAGAVSAGGGDAAPGWAGDGAEGWGRGSPGRDSGSQRGSQRGLQRGSSAASNRSSSRPASLSRPASTRSLPVSAQEPDGFVHQHPHAASASGKHGLDAGKGGGASAGDREEITVPLAGEARRFWRPAHLAIWEKDIKYSSAPHASLSSSSRNTLRAVAVTLGQIERPRAASPSHRE